jgi:polyhydroxybutyrate depolymerase
MKQMKIQKSHRSVLVAAFFMLASALACDVTSSATPTEKPTPLQMVAIQPMDALRTVTVDGRERTYFLHIPPGLNNRQSVALVFVFHGFSGNANSIRTFSGFDAISNANGFIVAYPNGTGRSDALSWNAGTCCGYANENVVDEPAFVRKMLADVETIVGLDSKRIYATGFSNGAFMAYALACEMSDTFAAVAPVAGVLLDDPCQPQQPVSLMHIHGLADTVVPFEQGSVNANTGQKFSAVRESLASWAKIDGCAGPGEKIKTGLLTHIPYGPCAPGIDVELDTIDGQGHAWPSPYVVPVSQMIWDFFDAHAKP